MLTKSTGEVMEIFNDLISVPGIVILLVAATNSIKIHMITGMILQKEISLSSSCSCNELTVQYSLLWCRYCGGLVSNTLESLLAVVG